MKRIILLIIMFITLNINAQTDTTQTTVQEINTTLTQTERIIDKYGNKLYESFSELMTSTAPHVNEGFKIVVKLQIAKGIVGLLPFILFIIFLILFIKEYNKQNIERDSPFDDDTFTIPLIAYLILFVLVGFISIFSVDFAILHLLAPEWYAFKEIIELIQ